MITYFCACVFVFVRGALFDSCEYSEVYRSLVTIRGLYTRYRELGNTNTVESLHISKTIRNNLRTLEWDLEDLEDTINILCKYFIS